MKHISRRKALIGTGTVVATAVLPISAVLLVPDKEATVTMSTPAVAVYPLCWGWDLAKSDDSEFKRKLYRLKLGLSL